MNPTLMDIGTEDDETYIQAPERTPTTQPATIPLPHTTPAQPTKIPAGV